MLGLEPLAGNVAVLVTWLGTTTFDGAGNSPLWIEVEPWLQARAEGLGLAPTPAAELAFTLGLALSIAVVALVYRAGVAGMRSVAPGTSATSLATRFAPALVPIAFAYLVAHYLSFFAFQGQALPALISDPLGSGADFFGMASVGIDYTVLSPAAVWYLQVGALVVGHIGGLVVSHERALGTWRSQRLAVRSQYWALPVMVGYTSLGLWLLSGVGT